MLPVTGCFCPCRSDGEELPHKEKHVKPSHVLCKRKVLDEGTDKQTVLALNCLSHVSPQEHAEVVCAAALALFNGFDYLSASSTSCEAARKEADEKVSKRNLIKLLEKVLGKMKPSKVLTTAFDKHATANADAAFVQQRLRKVKNFHLKKS